MWEKLNGVMFTINIDYCSKLILQKFLRSLTKEITRLSWQNYVKNYPKRIAKTRARKS